MWVLLGPCSLGSEPLGDPSHAGQASYWGTAVGGVLAAFPVVLAPHTVTLGPYHMETLLPNFTCWAELGPGFSHLPSSLPS